MDITSPALFPLRVRVVRTLFITLTVLLLTYAFSLFNARDIPELYGRNRNILRCIPFGTWPGRRYLIIYMDTKVDAFLVLTVGSGTFGLKTDAARFLLECERVPPSDITHFLTAKAQEVTIRGEVIGCFAFSCIAHTLICQLSMVSSVRSGQIISSMIAH